MAVACFRAGISSGLNQTAADEELNSVEEDVDAADPEANSEHFMAILVECLALLNKVPDIIEVRACLKKRDANCRFSTELYSYLRQMRGGKIIIND
jgi:hypothetical protein